MQEIDIEKLQGRVADLESRVKALENKPAPKAEKPVVLPSHEALMKEELAELETEEGGEKRIQLLMDRGVTRKKAEAALSSRKEFLRVELGIEPKGPSRARRLAGTAALLVGLLMFVFALAPRASAQDQQGQSQQFVFNTNFPLIVTAGATSNLVSPLGLANYGLYDKVIIHRGQGLGLEWLFNGNAAMGTQNAGMIIAPSEDGTNIDSWNQWVLIGKAFGVTNVTATTNWNANQLAGYKALFILGETNLGTGILTNGGTAATAISGLAGYTTNVSPATWNVPVGGP